MDEDVAKGRRDENRRKRGEGNAPIFADALANIHVLRTKKWLFDFQRQRRGGCTQSGNRQSTLNPKDSSAKVLEPN